MHHLVDNDALVDAVSSKIGVTYRLREECAASATSSYFKLVRADDPTRRTILVAVSTRISVTDFDGNHLKKRFRQNVAFLEWANDVNLHPLCPTILAWELPTERLGLAWVAYVQVEGWRLSDCWHELHASGREAVVSNLAKFSSELAQTPLPRPSSDDQTLPTVDVIGSLKPNHVMIPTFITSDPRFWDIDIADMEMKLRLGSNGKTPIAKLLRLLVEKRKSSHAALGRLEESKPKTITRKDRLMEYLGISPQSLLEDQLDALLPLCMYLLSKPSSSRKVLAHLNLDPTNIWVDASSGKITAILGWEYAHFTPLWCATSPLPWIRQDPNEKSAVGAASPTLVEPMLTSERMLDPWVVWRRSFHQPSEDVGSEMEKLREVWDRGLAENTKTLQIAVVQRKALRACFVDDDDLDASICWARSLLHPTTSTSSLLIGSILVIVAWVLAAQYVASYPYRLVISFCIAFLGRAGIASLRVANSYHPAKGQSRVYLSEPVSEEFSMDLNFVYYYAWILERLRCVKKGKGKGKGLLIAAPCSPASSVMPNQEVYIPAFWKKSSSGTDIGARKVAKK